MKMPQFTTEALRWLQTILQERFGHTFVLTQEAQALVLTLQNSEGSIRFDRLQAAFHQSRSDFPCYKWRASAEGYTAPVEDELPAPSATALPSPLIEISDNGTVIHYDILGLTYWMLTRLEEVGRTDLDDHQRFAATSSHGYQHDYLERPLVDEWLHILGHVIRKQWPALVLKQHLFRVKVSHDVDEPSAYSFISWRRLPLKMGGSLLRRRDLKAVFQAPWIKFSATNTLHRHDPYNTFDRLMDISEQNGLTSAFYFICGRSSNKDADYELEHPIIQNLMRRIHQRGHEIGLHPSYGTYQKPQLIKQEANRLRAACLQAGITQQKFGGRMHFLRWEQPTTMQAWEEAGMDYDSTLSFADRPGFRCGTCFEYPAFNPVTQQGLKLRIRPLIVMESSIIATRYMGLGYSDIALLKFLELKEKCYKVSGCFSLLWHNSHFGRKEDFDIYSKVLDGR